MVPDGGTPKGSASGTRLFEMTRPQPRVSWSSTDVVDGTTVDIAEDTFEHPDSGSFGLDGCELLRVHGRYVIADAPGSGSSRWSTGSTGSTRRNPATCSFGRKIYRGICPAVDDRGVSALLTSRIES